MLHSVLVGSPVVATKVVPRPLGEDVEDAVALQRRRGRSRLDSLRGNESSN